MISVADRDFDDGLGCLSVHHDVLTFSAHSVASMSADDAATLDGGCRMHYKNPKLFQSYYSSAYDPGPRLHQMIL